MTRLQRTEWQVVLTTDECITDIPRKIAKNYIGKNGVTEVRKIILRCHEGETWDTDTFDDEWQRKEIIVWRRGIEYANEKKTRLGRNG